MKNTAASCGQRSFQRRINMFAIIGLALLLMWLAGFFAFHVTVGFIHILLLLAVVSFIYHFVAGRSATA